MAQATAFSKISVIIVPELPVVMSETDLTLVYLATSNQSVTSPPKFNFSKLDSL
ncbi:MAG: hypothetical protein H6689_01455 [Erysipelotrichaceae bacterium]|nr:hypothetical protein [Erysipelotrichaceae bacterium]